MTRTIGAADLRKDLHAVLNAAEEGQTTLIVRNSKPSAAMVPAADLEVFDLFRMLLRELGESLELSRDPEVLVAVRAAQERIARGNVIWDDGR